MSAILPDEDRYEDTPDDDDDLNDEDCQKLIDEFVSITDTNDAIGQMFLQQQKWKLLSAVDDYFEQVNRDIGRSHGRNDSSSRSSAPDLVQLSSDSDADADDENSSPVRKKVRKVSERRVDPQASGAIVSSGESGPLVRLPRSEFVFVTWNIDGISEKNLKVRTEGVVDIVQKIRPDVLFLQEVIPESEAILRSKLAAYTIISGRMWKGFQAQYYTLTLVLKDSVTLVTSKVIDFDLSLMTRNVTMVRIQFNGLFMNLMNTHLESTKDYASHRMNQMAQMYRIVKSLPSGEPVLIAGDLNMRDKELEETGGLPDGWIDVWEATGKRPELRYTWDTLRNDNLDTNFGRYKPRCRFDRVIVKDTIPRSLVPKSLNLIGIERLKPNVCFPSDHWGILSVFTTFPPVTESSADAAAAAAGDAAFS